ncbi:HhH-GDP family DNA glycosylase [Streptomyces beihaiensis]|uniref:Endonuclease n=1 Tax=Streptomyces beihaiensis TaxID=2984495 RepID=A0ABT3TPY9_9ACTN|nr:endonuclease [Streptomyces beihaiensis]MCX3058576.1 endonuclease [Streptomyces beihaiensis]
MTTKATKTKNSTKNSTEKSTEKSTKTPDKAVVRALLERQERTYAAQAGIRLRNTPAPLYQTLVLAVLLSARIKGSIAVAAATALFDAGMRDARSMADATWQQRVDALGEGGYRRYDERTATMLGKGAELLLERYDGDLRRLREGADPKKALQDIPGIGPVGADIFLRDVQGVWPEFAPYIDGKALDGARRLGLPDSPGKLSGYVSGRDLPRLADGLVHAALDKPLAEEVLAAAGT